MLPLLMMLACSDKGEDSATEVVVASILVEPATPTLSTRQGEPGSQVFTARATLTSGAEVDLTRVSWEASPDAVGAIDAEGLFTASEHNGGAVTITASYQGVEGSAALTVIYEDHVLAGAPDGAPEAFAAASPGSGGPRLTYPLEGASLPRNMSYLAFAWDPPADHDVFQLRFQSALTDISVYTDEPRWEADADLWARITATSRGDTLSVTVTSGAWSGGSVSGPASGATVDVRVNATDPTGSVVYWTSLKHSIMRLPMGAHAPEVLWEEPAGLCVGCHIINEPEDLMTVVLDGWNGSYSTIDVADPADTVNLTGYQDNRRGTFGDYHPDGELLAMSRDGQLILVDAFTGADLQVLPTDKRFSMPEWAPDGDAIIGVNAVGDLLNDAEIYQTEIVEYGWDGSRLLDSSILTSQSGDSVDYAPSYSPDGEWIAYLHADRGSTLSNPNSELWVMSRDGAIKARLDSAMGSGERFGFPRWGPLTDDGSCWLTFSAVRDYAPDPAANGQPQLWVTTIDLDKAATGEDPSSPAFWLSGQDATGDNHLPQWWSR